MTSSEKEKAFLELINEHQNRIYRICWGFTADPENVKDLFQEIVYNIWKGYDSFRREATYATWIHKICLNTCILWKKKSSRRTQLLNSLSENPAVNPERSFEEENPKLLQLRKNIQALQKLDRSLALMLLEGLTYKEIAEVTGMSTNHVGVRINRIKIKLKNKSQKKY